MLQFRCTAKVQKEIGLKAKDLNEITDGKSMLGNWYVNISTIDRRKTFLFVNERTLLSFILYGIKKSNISNIHEAFLKALNQLLMLEGIDYSVIDKLNNEYLNLQYTKTGSKQVLGNMNDLMSLYKHFIYSDGGLKHCDLTEIIHRINRTPQKNIGWGYSIDLAKELLLCKQRT
ncbi:MAG: hypothetical protein OQK98_00750 [Gammaproteobacteria bacterium]|nr:hypothetical protein [Gammaproteobacteria bacterium]